MSPRQSDSSKLFFTPPQLILHQFTAPQPSPSHHITPHPPYPAPSHYRLAPPHPTTPHPHPNSPHRHNTPPTPIPLRPALPQPSFAKKDPIGRLVLGHLNTVRMGMQTREACEKVRHQTTNVVTIYQVLTMFVLKTRPWILWLWSMPFIAIFLMRIQNQHFKGQVRRISKGWVGMGFWSWVCGQG